MNIVTRLATVLAYDLSVPETYVRAALPLGLVAVLAMSGAVCLVFILGGNG